MEDFYKIGAEYEFIDSLCSTIFDIKAKYYALLRTKAFKDIAQYNLKLNEEFVKLAKAKNKADLTTAELNLTDAKVNYIDAQNAYENDRVNLTNAMYLESEPDFSIKPTPTFDFDGNNLENPTNSLTKDFPTNKFSFTRENVVQLAYDNSPDLSVLISTKQAMEQSLLYIKRTYFPDLTANAGYGFNNSNQATNNSLQIGVNLSSSVNLMELKHNLKGANAQVKQAENEILLFKKDLYFELSRAFNNFERAEKEISTTKIEVVQAFENLNTVLEQYKNNELNYVALQEARKDYIKSLNNYAESLYDYNLALIQVEMATHIHLADIHHKSEHAMKYHFHELVEDLNKALDCDEHETKPSHKEKL